MSEPIISIIMPVYNAGEYLKTAVESILCQDFPSLELILVDDGSTDGSREQCDAYAGQDQRVVVIHQKNQGICAARNKGINIAQGGYIGFADHDDEFMPGAFSHVMERIVETNADVAIFGKYEEINRGGEIVRSYSYKYPDALWDKKEIRNNFLWLKNNNGMESIWNTVFRKELLLKHPLDTFFKKGGEDIALMYDVLIDSDKIVLLSGIYYKHYLRRGFSTSTKIKYSYVIETCENLMERFAKALDRLDINPDNQPNEYTWYFLRSYIFPVVAHIADEHCPLSFNEKVKMIKEMLHSKYSRPYVLHQWVYSIFKRSPKYGLGYFLLKYRLWYLLIKMFGYRVKRN